MDTLFKEDLDKVAMVATVSDGVFGGVRVMEQVLPILVNFNLRVSSKRLHVALADKVFNDRGEFVDEEAAARFQKFVDAIETTE